MVFVQLVLKDLDMIKYCKTVLKYADQIKFMIVSPIIVNVLMDFIESMANVHNAQEVLILTFQASHVFLYVDLNNHILF